MTMSEGGRGAAAGVHLRRDGFGRRQRRLQWAPPSKRAEDFSAKLNEVAKFSVTTFPQAALVQWYKVGTEAGFRRKGIQDQQRQPSGCWDTTIAPWARRIAVSSKAVALMAFSSESKSNSPGILSVTVPVSVPIGIGLDHRTLAPILVWTADPDQIHQVTT